MEPRQKDERRCETDKRRRFKIDKLEDRIAPTAQAACDALHDAAAVSQGQGQQFGMHTAINQVC